MSKRPSRARAGGAAKPDVQIFRMPADPEDTAGPQRYYHGGPPGLRGQVLPRSATGVPGMLAVIARKTPDEEGATRVREGTADVISPPGRCYVTTSLVTAAYAAGLRAATTGQYFGVVYLVQPHGELVADFDMPFSWLCESAAILGSRRWIVHRPEFPALRQWVLGSAGYHAAAAHWYATLTAEDAAATHALLCQHPGADSAGVTRLMLKRWGHVPHLAAALGGLETERTTMP